MTISTMPWTSNGVGDGPAVGHGLEVSRRMFRHLWTNDPTVQGVVRGAGSELALSHSTPSEIDVAAGAALVYGTFVWSDAVETLTLDGVAADTAGIVVVGIDWTGAITGTAQTGFIRAVQAVSGSTTFPTPTQTDLTSWEVEIGRYIVDSGGDVWTDTGKGTAGVLDTRRFVGQILDMDRRQGGSASNWGTAGATNYVISGGLMQFGVIQTNGVTAVATVTFPRAFASEPFYMLDGGTAFVGTNTISATQINFTSYGEDGSTILPGVPVRWIAIGEPA